MCAKIASGENPDFFPSAAISRYYIIVGAWGNFRIQNSSETELSHKCLRILVLSIFGK